jgi:plastocyanin
MKTLSRIGVALASVAAIAAFGSLAVTAQVNGNDNKIAIMDDCLPGDPGYTVETGGCTLKPHQGDVPAAEFGGLLRSPLAVITGATGPVSFLVGHPSWRNEPSHLTVRPGKTVRVTNHGGRGHTFTEVANFGGGFVAPLNVGMTPAPECVNPASPPLLLAPGATVELAAGAPGLHKFECCIHPWMRATVRVE